MKRKILGLLLVLAVAAAWTASSAYALTYEIFDDFGGTWYDADKTSVNTDDDLMCWAAAASNIQAWGGWDATFSGDHDAMFQHYNNHWEDLGSLPTWGWEWWFDGTYDGPTDAGWSQPDVAGGGGFYPSDDFWAHYQELDVWGAADKSAAMSAIDTYLHDGYGTTLGIYGPGGHAITVWGFDYHLDNGLMVYDGIWITDSDDDKYVEYPTDMYVYVDVELSGNRWYLQDYYGTDAWWIGKVMALDAREVAEIPDPLSVFLLGSACVVGFLGTRRRKSTD